MTSIKSFFIKNALYIALLQAIVAMLGSLYFSEIRHYTPCVLCWYQRIGMYPLVLVLIVGILRKDRKVYQYVFPPALIAWAISIYHNLLYWRLIPEADAPCATGVSCTTHYVAYFGFVTIPFLSFTAFTVIMAMMLIQRHSVRKGLLPVSEGTMNA